MASGTEWDAEKMLHRYIHDYLVKRNMHGAAEVFAKEANVGNNAVVMDGPYDFLKEWWTVFWELYSHKVPKNPKAMPIQMIGNKKQNVGFTLPKPGLSQQMASELPTGDLNPNLPLPDVDKFTLSKPSSSHASHSQQQIPQKAQQLSARGRRRGNSLGRTGLIDSTIYGAPNAIFPSPGLHDEGIRKGSNSMPLKGWPLDLQFSLALSSININPFNQIPPGNTYPVLNSLLPMPNQRQPQTSTALHQQHLLSQELAKTPGRQVSPFQGSTYNLGNLILPWNDVSGTDGSMKDTRREIVDQRLMGADRKMEEQQQNAQMMHQQLDEKDSRKRKKLSNSKSEENALNRKNAEVEKLSDDIMESFLSDNSDNADVTCISFTNQRHSTVGSINEQNGFPFKEVGSLHSSEDKVLCCHFSSDGKLLASAGLDKKVLLWSMTTYDNVDTAAAHSHLITDVRFSPRPSIFATSSFDRTVQIWDANNPRKSLVKLIGHAAQVTSLDFHPKNADILCSCDSTDEIRIWNVNQLACTQVFKGASRQVRFQPQVGNLLAAASGNQISLFDAETNILQNYLEGHVKEVRSICWDTSGKYIASVSDDSARVWAVGLGGKCIHELPSNGSKFESCTFHPGYSQLLVIGSCQSLDLWNLTMNNKALAVAAHSGIISALADCPLTETIASASHDRTVKLWR